MADDAKAVNGLFHFLSVGTFCYWTVMFAFFNSHYPYNSIYQHPCWDDNDYSYSSLIVGWPMFAATPQITGSLFQWSECRMNPKNISCKNINQEWFQRIAHAWDVFRCDIVSVDQIAHGKYDCMTVILTMIFYRSLASESSVTGLGGTY